MRQGLLNWVSPICLGAIALACASAIQFLTPRLKNVAIDDGARRLEDIPFPFLREASTKTYRITGGIDRRAYQFASVTLLPTACLSYAAIEGQPLLFPAEHCDFINGYDLRLPTEPHVPGVHLIPFDAAVSTDFGVFGLSERAPARQPVALILRLIASAALVGGLFLALRRWQLSRAISLILVAALPVQLLYLSHTPVSQRTYDVIGHLQHIEFIADHSRFPSSAYCYECHQPSLYYVLAAAVYSVARATRIFDPAVVLQFFSLAWFWVFLVMSARIVLLWLPEGRETQFATALLAFWPGGFLHSVRVSNDVPLYAFSAMCLYFLLSWWKTGSRRHLLIAAVIAGCGVLIKLTMMALVAAIGILILCQIVGKRDLGKQWSSYMAPVLGMVAGLLVYIGQSFFKGGIYLPNWPLLPSMYVGNGWKQYLVLDLPSYFASPFVDSIRGGTGREYFWNYVLKSSMFGDFAGWFPKPVERDLALVMSPLLLGLVAFVCIGIARNLLRSARQSLPLLLVIAFSFLFLFAFRFSSPYSANNEFRYVYPALIPIVLFLAEGTKNIGIARALCFSFCGLSAAFYLSV